jgi:hypothetical protein
VLHEEAAPLLPAHVIGRRAPLDEGITARAARIASRLLALPHDQTLHNQTLHSEPLLQSFHSVVALVAMAVTVQSGLLAEGSRLARWFVSAVLLYFLLFLSIGPRAAARAGCFLLTILPVYRLAWYASSSVDDLTKAYDTLESHFLAVATAQACMGIWLGAISENRTANHLTRATAALRTVLVICASSTALACTSNLRVLLSSLLIDILPFLGGFFVTTFIMAEAQAPKGILAGLLQSTWFGLRCNPPAVLLRVTMR